MKKVQERLNVSADWKIEPANVELIERVKKLEDQMSWIIDRHFDTGHNPKIEKHDIQINCLRQQVLALEGKKSYTEQAREYANIRSTDNDQSK